MTRTSYATPAFDGTAALKPRSGARLVLIEGGRSAATERAEMARPLSVWQSMAFLALGALLLFSLCAASVLTDELASDASEGVLSGLGEQELVVHDGDSLWSIASSLDLDLLAGNFEDTNKYVALMDRITCSFTCYVLQGKSYSGKTKEIVPLKLIG